ncbi:TetR/AcrR family transcriptional regulator [Acidihalobacter aeolianus]|nr:TetR/AcrR family transcriptional regulator [Acidihalobacter aeolianus]
MGHIDLTGRLSHDAAMESSANTRERILVTARDLIHARSYNDVGVAEICQQANVLKGSFYHFFPSKRDLTLAVLERIQADAKTMLLDRAFDPAVSPLERLDRLVAATIELQRESAETVGHVLGCPVGNLATELATQDEPIRVATAKAFDGLQARIRGTLEEAGDTLFGVDLDATALAMVAYFEGVLMMAKTQNSLDVLRRLLPALRDIRVTLPAQVAGAKTEH